MLEPLLHKSPAPPAAVASPSLPRRAAPPPPVALSTPPPRSSRHQSTAAPSPPPPTPPRSATAPSSPTPTITARSASLPLGPAPPPRFPVSAGRRGVVHYFVGLAWSRRGAAPPRQPCGRGAAVPASSTYDEDLPITFLGRLLRSRRNTNLPVRRPVSVPSDGGEASRLRSWVQTLRRDLMPESDVHKQLAIFGFVLYGIMTLLPSTQALIKEFPPGHRVAILLTLGFVWTLSSTGVRCTISGRTSLDHTVAKVASLVGMVGITLLVIFHIGLMLPQNYWRKEGDLNRWSAGGFVVLIIFAILGHVVPLLMNVKV